MCGKDANLMIVHSIRRQTISTFFFLFSSSSFFFHKLAYPVTDVPELASATWI